jgi:hypothetical protein
MLFFVGSVVRESPLGFLWPGAKKKKEAAGGSGSA